MRGIGTIINVALILLGGILGLIFGKRVKEKMKETVIIAMGVAVMVMAVGGIMEKMMQLNKDRLTASGSIMMIISLVLGAVIGETIDIDLRIEHFGIWLKKKSNSENEDSFVSSFVTASCIVCVGAMAILGSIEDGINGNYYILLSKGILDAIIIFIMSASKGKGAVFSAIPVAILQGSVTLIAIFLGEFMPPLALSNLSYVGNVLILCVGINLVFDKKIRVANILPAIIIASIWGSF